MKQANMVAPAAPKGMPEAEFHQGFAEAKRWVEDFKKAGGSKIYVIGGGDNFERRGPALFAPATDANAKPLASLLFSGKLDGPTKYQNMNDPRNQLPRAEVVPGKGAVWGSGESVNYVKTLTPANRPDFTAALKAVGDAPARMIFAPDAKFRAMLQKQVPPQIMGKPSTVLTQDLLWAAAAVSPPPGTQGKVVIQAKDAPSAQAALDMLNGAFAIYKAMQGNAAGANLDPAMAAV